MSFELILQNETFGSIDLFIYLSDSAQASYFGYFLFMNQNQKDFFFFILWEILKNKNSLFYYYYFLIFVTNLWTNTFNA